VKAALDTNFLVYTEQRSDKGARARTLSLSFPERTLVLPAQVCGELFNVLTRKAAFQAVDAAQTIRRWRLICEVADTTDAVLDAALDLAVQHHLAIWDAMILAAASDKRCDLLLSEDLHPGFRWRGVTVVNPFAEPMSPLLDAFLDQGRG
jgi:predicted nucleic acid-binding protein